MPKAAPMYETVKLLHMTVAMISVLGFFVRGLWMLSDSAMLSRKWVRIAPHIVDTILLASAITLLITLALNPLNAPWVLVKIVGVLLYIGLGVVALRGPTRTARTLAFVAAIAVVIFIFSVAFSKLPLGFFA
ncbi:MAG: SirB2 family protein [Pseudomonadota bacterium]